MNEQEKCEEMAHNVDLQFSQFGKLGMVVKCIRVSVWLLDICIIYQIFVLFIRYYVFMSNFALINRHSIRQNACSIWTKVRLMLLL